MLSDATQRLVVDLEGDKIFRTLRALSALTTTNTAAASSRASAVPVISGIVVILLDKMRGWVWSNDYSQRPDGENE